ncbi:hypothetical protein ABTK13_20355, partial [Acinetobacter baumannii]
TYQITYPAAGTEVLLNRLKYIHEKENIDVLIPNFDAELYNFMKLTPTLKSLGIATFLPSFEQFEARDKINLYQFGIRYGLTVPADKIIYTV